MNQNNCLLIEGSLAKELDLVTNTIMYWCDGSASRLIKIQCSYLMLQRFDMAQIWYDNDLKTLY
ncbi:MAG: hypothetical protein ACI9LM_004481 [Alteromonadaceae bacterium]|jgi:hypothetical protein